MALLLIYFNPCPAEPVEYSVDPDQMAFKEAI